MILRDSRHEWRGNRPANGKLPASRGSTRPSSCPDVGSQRIVEPLRPDATRCELLALIEWQRVSIDFLAADRNRLAAVAADLLLSREGAR